MVSIIITYIDEHDYLAEAIKSAMSQDLKPIEVIVVCNMPTLPEGYNPLSDYPSIIFVHEPTSGSAKARNAGLRKASGDWVQFLDVDDLLLPGKIRNQLSKMEGQVIVSPHIFRFLNGSTQIAKWLPEDTWTGLLNSGLGSTSSMIWHRETLIKLGGWSAIYQSHQEYELLFRLASTGHIITTVGNNETIIRERVSGSITIETQPIRAKEGIKLREKIWEYLVRHKLDTPTRKNAFLQYIFRQLRGLYRIDRNATMKTYKKHFTNQHFIPESIGIPFYTFIYHGFGFNMTERIFSAYRSVRDKVLPFLPKNS